MNIQSPKTFRFAIRVLRDFFLHNHGLVLTGGVAFNMMLSLIPLSAVIVVGFSHFFDQHLIMESLTAEVALIAPGFVPTLTDVLEEQTAQSLDDVVERFRINWVWMPPWGPEKITDDGRDMMRALGFSI